jgi:Protein of unknown function (DUF3455)
MISQLQRMITASVIVIAIQASAAMGQGIKVPKTPPEIEVPPVNSVYLKGSAVGTQNYVCLASETGFSWKFLGPQATLFVTLRFNNGEIVQQIATHFLSPNPSENGLPRATWQSSFDTSAVWAKAIGTTNDPKYVAPNSIPWLLLQVVGTQSGPSGGSSLTQTTYIQRLDTSGGVMPATGCSQASNVGVVALVPYTTDYYFYKAGN